MITISVLAPLRKERQFVEVQTATEVFVDAPRIDLKLFREDLDEITAKELLGC